MPPVLSDLAGALRVPVDAVTAVPELLSRASGLLGRVDALLDDAEAIVDRAKGVVDGAEEQINRVAAVVDGAEEQITRVATVVDGAEKQIRGVAEVAEAAEAEVRHVREVAGSASDEVRIVGQVAERAERLLGQTEDMLGPIQQPLTDLMPALARLAESFDPDEVDALITLIDRLPVVVEHVDEEMLPLMRSLSGAAPDIHGLLESVQRIEPLIEDIRSIFSGLPGAKLLRRRTDDEPA